MREGQSTEFIQASWRDAVPQTQGCVLAELGDPWCLTFVLGGLENLKLFHRNHNYAGHPGFHKFTALGSLQFFLEHSLETKDIFYEFSKIEWCGTFNFPYFISGNT